VRLLLDTRILVWVTEESGTLTQRERLLLEAPGLDILCSVVSLWELRLKWNGTTADGGRKGPLAPETLLEVARRAGWTLLPLLPEHAVTVLDVPVAHKDPFDELLLVQAQVEGLRLLTRDAKLRDHPLAIS
jgi:PIN domain nuclease of toxin-antitoxin system